MKFSVVVFPGSNSDYDAFSAASRVIGEDAELNASLYLGFDSWLGPMLIGYGWREGGEDQLFLEVGRPF